ncbi:AAA family ATPase, partial [Rhodococcus sp. EPR-134]
MSDWQAEDSVGAKDGVVAEDGLFEATPEESAIVDEPDVVSVAERALSSVPPGAPLAVRMRPLTLGEVVGQQHLLGPGAPLRRMVEGSGAASVLLYGPPGTGKTTLASLISGATGRRFEALSALSAGVKEVRGVIELARRRLLNGEQTV